MASTVTDPRLDIPRKAVAADLRMPAKLDRKALADDVRREIGRAIERALQLADITKQDASDRMGYGTNQAPLSRWISGVERPQFEKLFAIRELRGPMVQALAELSSDIEVTTTIRIRRAG